MKTVTTYIAFDDTEFKNEEACIEYEDKAKNVLTFFTIAYKFYDENKHIILIDFKDIDSILDDIYVAYDVCSFIYYTPKYFTNDVKKFNRIHLGFDCPKAMKKACINTIGIKIYGKKQTDVCFLF